MYRLRHNSERPARCDCRSHASLHTTRWRVAQLIRRPNKLFNWQLDGRWYDSVLDAVVPVISFDLHSRGVPSVKCSLQLLPIHFCLECTLISIVLQCLH